MRLNELEHTNERKNGRNLGRTKKTNPQILNENENTNEKESTLQGETNK